MLLQLSKAMQACVQSIWRWLRPLTQGISPRSLLSALLVHVVLAMLLLQWQLPPVASRIQPQSRIIEVSVFNATPALSPATALGPAQPANVSGAVPQPLPASKPAAALPKPPAARKAAGARRQNMQSNSVNKATPRPAQSAAPVTTKARPAADATPRLNTDAILNRYISQYQARAPGSAQLQAMQQSKASRQLAETAPQKRATTPGRHADVEAVLDDGSQIVRLSADRCVIADAGADLRKDIHSIRGTPCPQRNSDEAMFERIMAGIGKQR